MLLYVPRNNQFSLCMCKTGDEMSWEVKVYCTSFVCRYESDRLTKVRYVSQVWCRTHYVGVLWTLKLWWEQEMSTGPGAARKRTGTGAETARTQAGATWNWRLSMTFAQDAVRSSS